MVEGGGEASSVGSELVDQQESGLTLEQERHRNEAFGTVCVKILYVDLTSFGMENVPNRLLVVCVCIDILYTRAPLQPSDNCDGEVILQGYNRGKGWRTKRRG